MITTLQQAVDSVSISDAKVIPVFAEGEMEFQCSLKITTTNKAWENKPFIIVDDLIETYYQMHFVGGNAYGLFKVVHNQRASLDITIIVDGIYIPLKRLQCVFPIMETVIIPSNNKKQVTIPIDSTMQDCSVSYSGTRTTIITQVERTAEFLRFENQDDSPRAIVQLLRGLEIVAQYYVCFIQPRNSVSPSFVVSQHYQQINQHIQQNNQHLRPVPQPQISLSVREVKNKLLGEFLDLFVEHNDLLYSIFTYKATGKRCIPMPLTKEYEYADVTVTKTTSEYIRYSNNVTIIYPTAVDRTRVHRCVALIQYLSPTVAEKRILTFVDEPVAKKQK